MIDNETIITQELIKKEMEIGIKIQIQICMIKEKEIEIVKTTGTKKDKETETEKGRGIEKDIESVNIVKGKMVQIKTDAKMKT